ncbi:serine/threonine protein kinase [Alkalimarinus sediminis]|uniref:Stress response kinase A n=1 Tax=Alkalimarinus sediminis TaxID=1632866 RepID=A0A9E8HJV5_9ALTE|nr:serine/threonine protein kinase [Alkalimarinus sediminis]UZW74086.1 serine/threonine protein kinase [Alkalimarinus sediminis]
MANTLDQSHPYNDLKPETVIDAVESLGILSDARIFPLNSYENRVYQVGVEDGSPIIAKFYRPYRWSESSILEEHQFSWELFDHELPVVPPIKNEQNQTLHQYNGFQFSIFKRQGGHAPELDNLDNLFLIGRHLGRMHAIGAQTSFKYRPTITVDEWAVSSREFLLTNDFIPDELTLAYETLTQDLISKVSAIWNRLPDLKTLRIHGDCHGGNMLWRNDLPHFVDFDDCRNGPAIQDIWLLLSGDRQQKTAQLSEIVEGYNEFYDFEPSQLVLVEALRTLRIMNYSAWLAKRWSDPAFPHHFPWFNTERYWAEHALELREQLAALDEDPLKLF